MSRKKGGFVTTPWGRKQLSSKIANIPPESHLVTSPLAMWLYSFSYQEEESVSPTLNLGSLWDMPWPIECSKKQWCISVELGLEMPCNSWSPAITTSTSPTSYLLGDERPVVQSVPCPADSQPLADPTSVRASAATINWILRKNEEGMHVLCRLLCKWMIFCSCETLCECIKNSTLVVIGKRIQTEIESKT